MHLALLLVQLQVLRYRIRFGSGQGKRGAIFCLTRVEEQEPPLFLSFGSKIYIFSIWHLYRLNAVGSEVSDKIWFWPGERGTFCVPTRAVELEPPIFKASAPKYLFFMHLAPLQTKRLVLGFMKRFGSVRGKKRNLLWFNQG